MGGNLTGNQLKYPVEDWKRAVSAETNISGVLDTVLRICRSIGFRHIVYASANIRIEPEKDPLLLTSFPQKWVQKYVQSNYQSIDPVLLLAVSSALPVNWSSISRQSSRVRKFFAEAEASGVGRTGLTIGVNGPSVDAAVFSATTDMPEREWRKQSAKLELHITYIAYLMYERISALTNDTRSNEGDGLSLMEKSCLQWIADGLTMQQVADKLALTERTVRMHLSSTRDKLNAQNTTQAVAIMLRKGQLR